MSINIRPITVFSWHKPFLPALLDYIHAQSGDNFHKSTIILPHNRPRKYLTKLLSESTNIKKPILLPRMLTMQEVINLLTDSTNLQNSSLLDQVHILYEVVKKVAAEDDYMGKHFAHMDLANFLPWGTHLATLFEEYMFEMYDVQDIYHVEGEVSAKAAALLSSLGKIHTNYLEELQKKQYTTQGLRAMQAAKAVQSGQDFPQSLTCTADKQIFMAGFLAPQLSENSLLQALWKKNAHICLHSDPQVVTSPQNAHWSCADHLRLVKTWQAPCQLYEECAAKPDDFGKQHFFSGYDLHSQLLAVKDLLSKQNDPLSTAIVLTTPGLLMPMLHHLPNEDFNVSMGYPLNKSPLFALLEAIARTATTFTLHEKNDAENKQKAARQTYYWRALLHCVRHPYMQMLKPLLAQNTATQDQQSPTQSIRAILKNMENSLRQGSRYVDAYAVANDSMQGASLEQCQLVNEILSVLLDNFATVKTASELATALSKLYDMLFKYGKDIWDKAPLDKEALYRLKQNIIPSLSKSMLKDEPLPLSTLFSLMQHLMQVERVPFEADPITGLQLLGMLETRLLHFERVIIVDATDDILPGFAAQDPLLPDALRHMLGLPSSEQRERNTAHFLHRLMGSAKEVHFYWQEGSGKSNLFDGKKSRSRFIDSAIWKEEQSLGHIIENGEGPLMVAPCEVKSISKTAQQIVVTEQVRNIILQMLTYGISPTRLDRYIHCPQSFAWEYIYKFNTLKEVNEEHDPLIVGEAIHKILQELYRDFEGKNLQINQINPKKIQPLLENAIQELKLEEKLPPDSLIMLRTATPVRLKFFLKNQPETTHIVKLEHDLSAPINTTCGNNFNLRGKVDRIDLRNYDGKKQILVLDYKTGKLPKLNPKIWHDDDFWESLNAWTPDQGNGNDLLLRISESFASIQLPYYMQLCKHEYSAYDIFDSAWIDLAKSGSEYYLLGEKLDNEQRENIIKKHIPSLLSFILMHMGNAKTLESQEGDHCKYCNYGALCAR